MRLIGATTENPSFEVISPLLSRCQVYVLKSLEKEDLLKIIERATGYYKQTFGRNIIVKEAEALLRISGGDARKLMNAIELVVAQFKGDCIIDNEVVCSIIQQNLSMYDKKGENHYDIISAFIKSIRGSDPNAAVYWLARMIASGEDPLFIARRMLILASEDIGMADSRALEICIAAYDACHYLGYPECNVHLTHAVTYCALAPKSNSLYMAYEAAKKDAIATQHLDVPLQIRNAPTRLMKELGYGEGYEYAHDNKYHVTAMSCMPDELKNHHYYHPGDQGTEQKVQIRMKQIEELRRKIRNEKQ